MNKNNFDGVRIGLALIVVFSHLAVLTQLPMFASLGQFFDARFAVEGFFAISGFLVTKSFYSSRSTAEYLEKRFRRIYPAYTTAVLLCLAIGAYTSTLQLSAFFQHPDTWKYVLANLTFMNFIQPTLPEALTGNAIPTMNGSLWTIKVEVMLYFCIPLLVFFFRKVGTTITASLMFVLSVAWVYYFDYIVGGSQGIELGKQFPGQLAYFGLGAFLAVNSDWLARVKWLALVGVIALFVVQDPMVKLLIDPLAYATLVIFLSTSAYRSLPFGKYGDLSYGIYLYHFPIIQLLIFKGVFKQAPWLGLLLTFTLTLLAAWLSWHLIEKRLLKRNSHYLLATKA